MKLLKWIARLPFGRVKYSFMFLIFDNLVNMVEDAYNLYTLELVFVSHSSMVSVLIPGLMM